jgi:hypothetical protein
MEELIQIMIQFGLHLQQEMVLLLTWRLLTFSLKLKEW